MDRTIIIAEAGVNHNGDITIAKKLIDKAKEAGVDYVKFQMFKTNQLVSKNAVKADYQKQTTDSTESQLEMIQKLELSEDNYNELFQYAKFKGIELFSTAFDLESINTVYRYKPEIVKIPSGEITNLPYLEKLCDINYCPWFIISTGMATLSEIEGAINVLRSNKQNRITILHCNTEYPTPMEDVNLKAMQTLGTTFGVDIGYSDHTLGIEIPIAAVAMGAGVIEKHFTLDRNMEGPDHKASLEPDELKQMVSSIRNIERALGSSIKQPSKSELKNKNIARKSIVAKTNIKLGETFTVNNLTIKRPGSGISPMDWYKVLGTKANKNYKIDDLI
jgi:N,N'-diacetyllegionaminate synthase